jgi:hypothetical protein
MPILNAMKQSELLPIRTNVQGDMNLARPQQKWFGDNPEIMQTAYFAGQKIVAICDEVGCPVDLDFLGFRCSGFASMKEAQAAAPKFARQVLEKMIDLITE